MADMSRDEILTLAERLERGYVYDALAMEAVHALRLLAGEMGEPVAWRMTCIDPKLAKQPSPWVLLSSEPRPYNKRQYVVEPLSASPPARSYAEGVEGAVIAGWNACRKSVYAVCEDIGNEADRNRADTENQPRHHFGRGEGDAAKRIARAFNSLEARDDDNVSAVLRSLAPKEG